MDPVCYFDPLNRPIASRNGLQSAIPESFAGKLDIWRLNEVADLKLRDLQNRPDAVLHHGRLPLDGEPVYAPLVFMVQGRLYIVEEAIRRSGGINVLAIPLWLEFGYHRFACADCPSLTESLSRSGYLFDWWDEAVTTMPGFSFKLASAAGINLSTVRIIDKTDKSFCFRARPIHDEDWIDHYYLHGLDEGRDFLSQLPYRVETLFHAYAALAPLTPEQRKSAYRQGEWWFYPEDLPVPEEQLRPEQLFKTYGLKAPKKLSKASKRTKILRSGGRDRGLPHGFTGTYGGHLAWIEPESNHFADTVVNYQGRVWVQGTVRHITHDHEPLSLGNQWYRAIKNGAVRSYSITIPRREA